MADISNIKFIDIDKNEKDAYQHLLFDIASMLRVWLLPFYAAMAFT